MASSTASNLPRQTTSFVGRDQQIEEIRALLQKPDCRLLTLVGPGGIGKTRLAVAVAETSDLPVVYVPLQAVASADLLPSAIADAANITLAGHESLPVQLLGRLRDRRLLLVLDNFEHLLDRTDLIAGLLHDAPEVKLVVTSREALNLLEEWLYAVPGLSCPPPDARGNLAAFGAMQLFAERARQVRQDFQLDDELEHVVTICRVVDGMPLAIELAASWLRVLDAAAIAEAVRDGSDILTTRMRNVPERHQSIRAVFDGSWQMLSAEERDVFSKLTVFQGGFTTEASEEVASASLPTLASLVSKSFVYREDGGRYQIHELLRQYGAGKLAESPEVEAASHRAHGKHYMQFLAERSLYFSDFRQLRATLEIAYDLENVRKAWQWAVDHLEIEWLQQAGRSFHYACQFQSHYVEGADLFLNTAQRLETVHMSKDRGAVLIETLIYYGWLCIRLGRLAEAERAVARACQLYEEFELSPGPDLRGYPGLSVMFLALVRGDYDQAVSMGETVLRVAGEDAQPAVSVIPHYGMASAFLAKNDYARARTHAERSLSLATTAGGGRQATYALGVLGQVAIAEEDLQTARRHFESAYVICEEIAEYGCMAEHLANLAGIDLRQREWVQARQLFSRSLSMYKEIGDRGGIARTQLGLGIVALNTEELDAARRHFVQSLTLALEANIIPIVLSIAVAVGEFLLQSDDTVALGLRTLSFVPTHPSCDERTRTQVLDTLARNGLVQCDGDETYDDLASLVAALQVGLAVPAAESIQEHKLVESLTRREQEVLRLLGEGHTNPMIAEELIVTVGAVKFHTSNIYGKLGVANRTQAVQRARELGLLA